MISVQLAELGEGRRTTLCFGPCDLYDGETRFYTINRDRELRVRFNQKCTKGEAIAFCKAILKDLGE